MVMIMTATAAGDGGGDGDGDGDGAGGGNGDDHDGVTTAGDGDGDGDSDCNGDGADGERTHGGWRGTTMFTTGGRGSALRSGVCSGREKCVIAVQIRGHRLRVGHTLRGLLRLFFAPCWPTGNDDILHTSTHRATHVSSPSDPRKRWLQNAPWEPRPRARRPLSRGDECRSPPHTDHGRTHEVTTDVGRVASKLAPP